MHRPTLPAPRRDGLRALVHVERGADAVPGSVAVVEADGPERRARQRVQRQAGRALREHRAVQRDVALAPTAAHSDEHFKTAEVV